MEPATPSPEKQQPAQEQGTSLALPPSPHNATFNNAEQALAKFDWMQASVTLQEIPANELEQNDAAYLGYLQARISYIRGDQKAALAQLEQAEQSGH